MNTLSATAADLAALTLDVARNDDTTGAVAASLRDTGWAGRPDTLLAVIEVLARRCQAVHDAAALSAESERLRVLAALLADAIEAAAGETDA